MSIRKIFKLTHYRTLRYLVFTSQIVMPGLDPGIHVFDRASKTSAYDVDPRVKPGHDDRRER
jgi:hypothetical protein